MLVLSYVSLSIIAAFKEATVAFHEHDVPKSHPSRHSTCGEKPAHSRRLIYLEIV
ncbi:hypothetical protein HMPREF1492_0352 [Atopobium sp. BS2]|nr:hypothetical protein HMPREF1492_0352 [Atopobium sp. BS2]